MKIIIGNNKKNFIKKIKLISFKTKKFSYKYPIIRDKKIIDFIYDRRKESTYNDIILVILLNKNNQILKIIK